MMWICLAIVVPLCVLIVCVTLLELAKLMAYTDPLRNLEGALNKHVASLAITRPEMHYEIVNSGLRVVVEVRSIGSGWRSPMELDFDYRDGKCRFKDARG